MGKEPTSPDIDGRNALVRSWPTIEPWFGLVLRVGLAVVSLWAGLSKIGDLNQSVLAVRAYQLLPVDLTTIVGNALPMFEIILGLVLLLGVLTRYAAIVNGLTQIAFIFGIAWAWANGLSIDCGCFGGGGEVALRDGLAMTYFFDIVRDVVFLAASAYLVWRPRTKYSLDSALGLG